IARRAEQDAAGMHQLAERKVGKQHAYQEKMDEENDPDPFRYDRLKGNKSHGELLDLEQVHPDKIAGKNARRSDCKEEKKRKEILRKRYVAHLRDDQPSDQQVGDRRHKNQIGDVDAGKPDLENPVKSFNVMNEKGHRFGEKAQMPYQNDQEAVVEGKPCEPEPFFPLVEDFGSFLRLEFGIPEKRAEKEHFQDHPAHDLRFGDRIVELAMGYPGQGLLLAGRRRNTEGNGRARPLQDPENDAAQKSEDSYVRHGYAEEVIESGRPDPQKRS